MAGNLGCLQDKVSGLRDVTWEVEGWFRVELKLVEGRCAVEEDDQ